MSMLSPKRSKFRKSHKGNLKGRAKGGNEVSFGDYGLQVTSPGWLTSRQIEAARVAISRAVSQPGVVTWSPKSPNDTWSPPLARPFRLPLCDLRNFERLGDSIDIGSSPDQRCGVDDRASLRAGRTSPWNTQALTPMLPYVV